MCMCVCMCVCVCVCACGCARARARARGLTTNAVRKMSVGLEILGIAMDPQRVSNRAVGAVWIYVEVLDAQSPVCDVP